MRMSCRDAVTHNNNIDKHSLVFLNDNVFMIGATDRIHSLKSPLLSLSLSRPSPTN